MSEGEERCLLSLLCDHISLRVISIRVVDFLLALLSVLGHSAWHISHALILCHIPRPTSKLIHQVDATPQGLQALIFTAEGDMRQAINNLQSTASGFGLVSPENVYKICDQPHPHKIRAMIQECKKNDVDGALARVDELWEAGYSAVDIVTTIFRVTKGIDDLPEYLKLEYIRVSGKSAASLYSRARGTEGGRSVLALELRLLQ